MPGSRPQSYGAYTIKSKRHRRTKAAITSIRDHIKDILEQSHPQTVRQVFYAATVRGSIPKVEKEYQKTIVRLLGLPITRGGSASPHRSPG
jgi:hypothetical protein